MWFFCALGSAVLWTGISVYDKYSVKAVYSRPSQGLLVGGLFGATGGLIAIPLSPEGLLFLLFPFLAGLAIQAGQLCYFSLMDKENVGEVIAFGSAYPLVVAVVGIPLGDLLSLPQWLGVLLIVGPLVMLRGAKLWGARKGTIQIAGYVLPVAAASLLLSGAQETYAFMTIVPSYCAGLFLGGTMPFLLPVERRALRTALPSIRSAFWQLSIVEVVNIAALGLECYALGLANPALVTAVAAIDPVFGFLFERALHKFKPETFDRVDGLAWKLVLMIIMGCGLLVLTT